MKALREAYIAEQSSMDWAKLVFLDESGINVGMNRLYGWAPIGEDALILKRQRGKRLSIVGAMALDGPRGKMTFTGTLNSARMVEYIQKHLAPTLLPGDIVVLDGASIHKTKEVRAAFDAAGAKMLILPPYSPDLNPIEPLWATLKARLRAVGSASWTELVALMEEIWYNLDSSFYPNWVKAAGYGHST